MNLIVFCTRKPTYYIFKEKNNVSIFYKKNWIDHLHFEHCFHNLSNRWLNRETTNLCVWRTDNQAGLCSSPYFLSLITHIHANHCNISSLIRLCYETDSTLQFGYIHHWNTHTNNTYYIHIPCNLMPETQRLNWAERLDVSLLWLISATVVGGNMFHSLREKNYTHLTHISLKLDI